MRKCCCPKVNNFLCCWSIRTGSLFLGSFELVLFTSTLLGMLYSFDFAITIRARDAEFEGEGPHAALIALYIIMIVVCVIVILLSGMEVLGVLYKKPYMMIPYMVFTALRLLTVIVCGVVMPAMIAVTNPYLPVFSAAVVVTCIVTAIVFSHALLVLFTQYKRLKLLPSNRNMGLVECNRHEDCGFDDGNEQLEEDSKIV